MNRLYTAKQVAEILQINQQTVYRLAKRGELECCKVGRLVRFALPDREDKTICWKSEQR